MVLIWGGDCIRHEYAPLGMYAQASGAGGPADHAQAELPHPGSPSMHADSRVPRSYLTAGGYQLAPKK